VSASLLGNPAALWGELKAGWHVIEAGHSYNGGEGAQDDFWYTVQHTLRLGLWATGIAAVIGLPLGALLGLGRFRGRGPLLAIGNALTRAPPVVVGVLVILSISAQSAVQAAPGHGDVNSSGRVYRGPLAGLIPPSVSTRWFHIGISMDVFVQSLLALPIVIALTATALQRVAPALLEQAEACGASWFARGRLALREARAGVLASIIVAMGVTMTAIGALFLTTSGEGLCAGAVNTGQCFRYTNLGLATLHYGTTSQTNAPGFDTGPLGIAYAMLMMALFLVTAVALTFLQHSRSSWIAGGQS
jgi:ABC-type tungstate transport system substrate-binding protein